MQWVKIQTPESVDIALEPAGLGTRFLAILVDAPIQWTLALLLYLVLDPFLGLRDKLLVSQQYDAPEIRLFVLLVFFLFFAYKFVLEAYSDGQTLGKKAVGIRVVRSNGMPVQFLQVLIRNLLRFIDFLPSLYTIATIAILSSQQGQRLGDMAAGTMVVRMRYLAPPIVPTQLNQNPFASLDRLAEYVRCLTTADLAGARLYWQRRPYLEPRVRLPHARRIAEALAVKMDWQEPLPENSEQWIEAVLYARSRNER